MRFRKGVRYHYFRHWGASARFIHEIARQETLDIEAAIRRAILVDRPFNLVSGPINGECTTEIVNTAWL